MGQAGSWTKQEPLASAHSRSKSTLGEFSRMIHLSRMVLKPQAVAGDAVWIFNLILALGNLTVQKTVHEASEPSTVLSGLWTGSPCLAEVAFPLPAAPLPGVESTAALWARAPSRAQACLAISVLWQLDQGARNVGTGQKTALPPPPTGGPHCPWPQGVSGGGVSGRGLRECHGPPDSQNCHLASRAHPSHPAVSDLWPKRLGHKL